MKTFTPAVQAMLDNTHGVEPVNILAVQWVEDGNLLYYADKDIEEGDTVIPGSICEISVLESVVKFESRGQTQTISIKLSDTDGLIKDILNNHDIHGRPAKIYQWFDGLPIAEMFVLFEGEISSNIVWNEADRTITLDIITKLYATEAGFSPEEGQFTHIPDDLIGQPWPLAFGTVQNIPATRLIPVPEGQITSAVGAKDPTLDKKISDVGTRLEQLRAQFLYYVYAALQCAFTAGSYSDTARDLLGQAETANENVDSAKANEADADTESEAAYWRSVAEFWRKEAQSLASTGQQYSAAAKQAEGAQHQMEQTAASISQSIAQAQSDMSEYAVESSNQNELVPASFEVINGKLFPQNQTTTIQVGDIVYTGKFNGDTFTVDQTSLPNFNGDMSRAFGFTFEQTGTTARILSETKIVYIANILPSTVINIKAWYKSTTGGAAALTFVPEDWYTVKQIDVGGYTVTAIVMDKALSARDSSFENDIFVTLTSTVGPNTVDIMQWLIETYTDLSVDSTSFAFVKDRLENYPSHFALLERKNVLELLEDIAFQCRCAIWLKDRKFYLKYLSIEGDVVDAITEDDIEAGSFSVKTTSSEDVVTKFTATWRDNYAVERPNKIVFRHNIEKYGVREKEYEFFIYNIFQLVVKSASFWMQRYSHVWKTVKFTTTIHKLALDTFDTIELDLESGLIANSAVNAEITALTYDSSEKLIDIEAWLPIRIGDMEPFIFALPGDIDENTVFPDADSWAKKYVGGTVPGKNVNGDTLITSENVRITYDVQQTSRSELTPKHLDWGHRFPSDKHQKTKPTPEFSRAGTSSPEYVMDVTPYRDYNPDYAKLDDLILPKDQKATPDEYDYPAQCFPGVIQGGGGDEYSVDVYTKGLSNDPVTKSVKQLQIAGGTDIPAGTWVLVSLNYIKKSSDGVEYFEPEYTMQVPVWL